MRHTAVLLIFLTGLLHSAVGELLVLRQPRLTGALGGELSARRTVHLSWHLATVFAWALALLAWTQSDRYVLDVISDAMFGAAAITCVISRALHPGWIALAAAAVLLRG